MYLLIVAHAAWYVTYLMICMQLYDDSSGHIIAKELEQICAYITYW